VSNKTAGQWKAHGKYLARESATLRTDRKQAAFGRDRDKLNVSERLGDWQTADDPRLWKIIISPEFGARLNMQDLTRNVMAGVQKKLGVEVEWIAVAHYNTGHPHVHVAMRGVDRNGQEFRMPKELVRQGIRQLAAEWCTGQLGYRTREQAIEARRLEVAQMRYTSLDRAIDQGNAPDPSATHFAVYCTAGPRTQFQVARLQVLEGMGLARRLDAETWEVRRDFESVLRMAQKTEDRQRTLAMGGVLRSDERLPIRSLEYRSIDEIDGRILVHGEEDSGRSYMILEATDGVVYAINHTRAMQEMRNAGGLRVNHVVRLRKVFEAGAKPKLDIIEIGPSEDVLSNRNYLRQVAQRFRRKGLEAPVDGWGGWLGRYQLAVREAAVELGPDRTGEMGVEL
jgi:type IV secretory pathway VirD2 relaxase